MNIFVISTYQTLGAGQNFQYPIPETLKGHLDDAKAYLYAKSTKHRILNWQDIHVNVYV
ncbi:MAG: hypothetical protein K5695_05475 [Oscillospiraceae bacterium]|nr:hypothetical protein [Oscillospiraceae bacterium]